MKGIYLKQNVLFISVCKTSGEPLPHKSGPLLQLVVYVATCVMQLVDGLFSLSSFVGSLCEWYKPTAKLISLWITGFNQTSRHWRRVSWAFPQDEKHVLQFPHVSIRCRQQDKLLVSFFLFISRPTAYHSGLCNAMGRGRKLPDEYKSQKRWPQSVKKTIRTQQSPLLPRDTCYIHNWRTCVPVNLWFERQHSTWASAQAKMWYLCREPVWGPCCSANVQQSTKQRCRDQKTMWAQSFSYPSAEQEGYSIMPVDDASVSW